MSCYILGPVLSLAVAPDGDYCFSGGIDATIRCWNMPHSTVDPYDSYGNAKLSKIWLKFSTIFASFKWTLNYVTTHSKACLIFPYRSQCVGSHLNRTHGRSLEPFISGRKSSATTVSICGWYG